MERRLYVGNLPDDVSIDALRKRFAEHGAVADVQLAVDRASGRQRGYAFVTMETSAEARYAMNRLNGASFEDRPLRVNEAGAERDEPAARGKAEKPAVKITSQFRERNNMTYELDCRGVALSIKVFPVDRSEQAWRLEASAKTENSDVAPLTAESRTRALALEEIARAWQESTSAQPIDWVAVTEAMVAVRAI